MIFQVGLHKRRMETIDVLTSRRCFSGALEKMVVHAFGRSLTEQRSNLHVTTRGDKKKPVVSIIISSQAIPILYVLQIPKT
jgi:hypothetical protein